MSNGYGHPALGYWRVALHRVSIVGMSSWGWRRRVPSRCIACSRPPP